MKLSTFVLLILSCLLCFDEAFSGTFPDNIQSAVVAIGKKDANGVWSPLGTGFLMWSYENTPNLLVTNKHIFLTHDRNGRIVSRDHIYIKGRFKPEVANLIDSTNTGWTEFDLALSRNDTLLWSGHPDSNVDIGVIYFPPTDPAHILLEKLTENGYLPLSMCAKFNEMFPAQQLLFFGFPLGLGSDGSPRALVRGGIVSYLGSDKSFLLDAQVFGGSSGSPIFATSWLPSGLIGNQKPRLVGIIRGHHNSPIRKWEIGALDSANITDPTYVENSGLGVGYSTDLILETIKVHQTRFPARLTVGNK